MLAYMCMREMDLHKSVSISSILKSRFWLGSHIPVTDKLLAILILLPVLWMLFYFSPPKILKWMWSSPWGVSCAVQRARNTVTLSFPWSFRKEWNRKMLWITATVSP